MSDFSLIIDHPDNEEIVSKIVTGTTPKAIVQWLKLKYPGKDQKHLLLTQKIIKEFAASDYLDIHEQFKKDVDLVKSGDKKIYDSLKNNKSYKERLEQYADQELDIKKMVANLIMVMHERMEQVFDKIQENPAVSKGDYVLLQYFEKLVIAAEKLDKIINDSPDKLIQHNFTVQVIEQQSAAMQNALHSIITKLEPQLAMSFIEEFNNEVARLKEPVPASQEQRIQEATVLSETIINSESAQEADVNADT